MTRLSLAASFLALLVASCTEEVSTVPPPLPKIVLPSGADLQPFDAATPALAKPQGLALTADGRSWVALTNLDANYNVAAPGMLVGVTPSTGALTKVSLG